jgi:hypothetical protein
MGEEIKTEKTNNKQKRDRRKDMPHLFKPGQSGNPYGRPPGSLNFATKFRAFIEKVAKQNEMTADEIEQQLLAIGYKRAKEGDYQFWRDLHDRVYGKPQGSLDVTSKGDKISNTREEIKHAFNELQTNNKYDNQREES